MDEPWVVTRREERGSRRPQGTRREGSPLIVYLGATHNLGAKNHLILLQRPTRKFSACRKGHYAQSLAGEMSTEEEGTTLERKERDKNVCLLRIMARDRKMETTPEVGGGEQDAHTVALLHCSRLLLF